ncbi:DUF5590 domain-containing protein [Paenibacillus sp.]|uniref:cell wall elongation regulator TseB-like domain-containing protein n=1 Tax=Paenibacillus sp. TaxID=58172 RepID=UPI0028124A4F|nr:DUF5590 domain-containing protein [Paenibacillus sp.]
MAERFMSESSSNRRRAIKATAVAIVLIGAIGLFGSRFYQTVQEPHWDALSRAQAEAVQRLNLTRVDSVERFVGDRPYSIVFGANANGEDVAVWMWGEDGLHIERQSDGLTRDEVKSRALKERPEMQLLRISPGKLGETYVWEVFYALREPGGTRKYYDYYAFRDGTKLETYRLALERE